MIEWLVVLWLLCGIAGCVLVHSLTLAHPSMDAYTPGCTWFAIGGGFTLLSAVIIAFRYALNLDKETPPKEKPQP